MRCSLQAMQFTYGKDVIQYGFQRYTTITIINLKSGLRLQISKTSLCLLAIQPCVPCPTSILSPPHPRQPGVFLSLHLPHLIILYEWTHRYFTWIDSCLSGRDFIPFFFFLNVCVYVCTSLVYTSAHVCEYTCLWRSEINRGCCSLGTVYLSFETGSLPILVLTKETRLAGQWASLLDCVLAWSFWVTPGLTFHWRIPDCFPETAGSPSPQQSGSAPILSSLPAFVGLAVTWKGFTQVDSSIHPLPACFFLSLLLPSTHLLGFIYFSLIVQSILEGKKNQILLEGLGTCSGVGGYSKN